MIDRPVYCDRMRQRATVKDAIVCLLLIVSMSQSLFLLLHTQKSTFSSQKQYILLGQSICELRCSICLPGCKWVSLYHTCSVSS